MLVLEIAGGVFVARLFEQIVIGYINHKLSSTARKRQMKVLEDFEAQVRAHQGTPGQRISSEIASQTPVANDPS
jgi:hypothetical protein